MYARRPFQISVWTMLLGSTILTGYFAGYSSGGRQINAEQAKSSVTARNYGVTDIIRNSADPRSDLLKIIALIKQTVEPDSWYQPGIGALPYDANGSIIIQHTGATHAKISQLLMQLREIQASQNAGMVIGRFIPSGEPNVGGFRPSVTSRLDGST